MYYPLVAHNFKPKTGLKELISVDKRDYTDVVDNIMTVTPLVAVLRCDRIFISMLMNILCENLSWTSRMVPNIELSPTSVTNIDLDLHRGSSRQALGFLENEFDKIEQKP